VNGEPVEQDVARGTYLEIRRAWKNGDVVRLSLPMPVRKLESHPYVTNNAGRVALKRGPLVYCMEQAALGCDSRGLVLPADTELAACWEPDLLGGVTVLRGSARARDLAAAWGWDLYRAPEDQPQPAARPVEFTAIPYYAWANREPGGMA